MDPLVPAAIAAVALALVHLLAGGLKFVAYIPRSRWLSFAGGVPVAFVFLDLLPALARDEARLAEALARKGFLLEHHSYLLALVGLTLYYGVERLVRSDRQGRAQHEGTSLPAFWVSIGSFAVLNAMLGYLLVEEERSVPALTLFALAVGLKFFVVDRALHEDHRREYERVGRWVMVGSFLVGCAAGALWHVPDLALSSLRAFITGAILLNVMKEEVPAERSSRWLAFVAGAALYGGLVLLAPLAR